MADLDVALTARRTQRGRPPSPVLTLSCIGCGSSFQSKKADRKYCALDCFNLVQAALRPPKECEQCGVMFRPHRPGGKAIKGLSANGRFCSVVCYGASKRKQSEPIVFQSCTECGSPVQRKGAITCGRGCGNIRTKRLIREATKAKAVDRQFACHTCEQACVAPYGDKRSRFCSAACAGIAGRRVRKQKERARLKAAYVECVDPIKVFERDGWRCHLCGRHTPRKLRGSYRPNAPELDHIVPLSVGGDHSYRNTACACRACNGAKGAKIIGQPSLFSCG